MNFFVAGIDLVYGFGKKTLQDKTNDVIRTLHQIQEDAIQESGKDAVIIVVMHEYAMTLKAVTASEKKQAVSMLQKAVQQFDNMMLIPGSIAYEETYQDKSHRKTKKMLANYQRLKQDDIVKYSVLEPYLSEIEDKRRSRKLNNSHHLQNSAYIFTALERFKHSKCAPFRELLASNGHEENSVYYIGTNDFIKKANVNGNLVDTAILICLEHKLVDINHLASERYAPLAHVIVSDCISLNKDRIVGALNIQMDSQCKLTVVVNTGHYRFDKISSVKARLYKTNDHCAKSHPAAITTINKKIGPAEKLRLHQSRHTCAAIFNKCNHHKRERDPVDDNDMTDPTTLKRR